VIRQLAHICLFTDRLEELRRFYVEGLGLRFAFPLENPETKEVFGLYFAAGHSTFIEVFDRRGAQKMWGGDDPRVERGTGFRHLCFEVTGLDLLREKLLARGLQVTEPKGGLDGSRQAWTTDPDGNPVELMEYTGASLQLRR